MATSTLEPPAGPPAVEAVILPRTRDLGGFGVQRLLPSLERRMVGPFIFLDQMGPVLLRPGQGLDVLPHPHTGLATVTYLYEGALVHRDSLGTVRRIEPGAVNWMTAGRGIVHSERSPPEARGAGGGFFGIQTWVALPARHEEAAPAFVHTPAAALPALDEGGLHLRVVAGAFRGARSPVEPLTETIYVDARLDAGARLEVPPAWEERAVLVTLGEVEEGAARHPAGRLLVLRHGATVALRAAAPARLLLLGGEPADGPRHVWWNFVASTRERIERAADDWAAGRFAPVPGEAERIPLPLRPPGFRIR
jgi:redox-sensitive bicupin YhaK (pirin superfamily)